ncbi:MAG: sigma 54-interacting transcriptional regulator [Deltaproteobacteria bacterium]|nr:sigma 54-interacting transcriptional regulator [Deltaproteobacteria bacterium]
MATIRSLLWIGSGRSLAASGVAEAPELDVTWVPDLAEAERLPRVPFDGVLLELARVVEAEGRDETVAGPTAERALAGAIRRIRPLVHGAPILVALPEGCPSAAQAAIEAGAAGVLFLDPAVERPGFVEAVSRALDDDAARVAAALAADSASAAVARMPVPSGVEAAGQSMPSPLIAQSPAMREVLDLVALAAGSPSTVLLTGETGAGKEVVARQLHLRSERAALPFVPINCAAFPEALLESELFGHVKGAFTGADRTKPGLFEVAGAGTLFLDEIAEMDLSLQAKLLRVLQEREIRPIGGTRSIPVHCRIVAATNRVLQDEVRTGHFREDLFYRLNVFPIRVPPLRERRRDILPLARHFLALHGPREGKRDCHLSLSTSQLLESYDWPGNVRELENEMLRVLMLVPSGSLITPKALSRKLVEILEPVANGAGPDETLRQAVERVEAWLIRRALANNGGRKTSTARRLGLTREGLYKKLKRLGIE